MLNIRSQLGLRPHALAMLRPAAPSITRAGLRLLAPSRGVSTDKISKEAAYEVLVNQRKNRPLSPDLQIYKLQLTSTMSALHRITGVAIGGAFYLYALLYAFGPYIGLGFTPAGVAAAVAGVPFAAKFLIKLIVATPFTYHSWNGIRHLIWDAGKALTIPDVYKTGYVVVGLTAVTSLALALL